MNLRLEIDKESLGATLGMLADSGANMRRAGPRIVSDALTMTFRRVKELIDEEGISPSGPYAKGVTMSPVKEEGEGEFVGLVGNTARNPVTGYPYPLVIEYGTKLPYIVPKKAKALHFFLPDGTEIFAKRVKGKKPRFIYKRARDFAAERLRGLVLKAMRERGRA